MNPTISKFCHSSYMVITLHNQKYCNPSYYFPTWQCQNFIKTPIGIFLGLAIPNMNPNEIAPPLTRFSPGCFALIRLLQKIMHFNSKINFIIQLIPDQFWYCCLVYICFLGCFSHFCLNETTKSFKFAYMHSVLFGFSSNHVA